MEIMHDIFGIASDAVARMLSGYLPEWAVAVAISALAVFTLLLFLVAVVMVLVYLERRVLARMQDRRGPNRVGKWGMLQPVADVMKLLLKEDLRPRTADPVVFFLAPLMVVVPALLVFAVIPFGRGMAVADLNIGLLFVLAIGGLPTLGVMLAGWGSGNKYSVLGGMRAAAQMVSFGVPLVLALVSPILIVGSLSMVQIVEFQAALPLVVLQPVAFAIYLVAGVAEANRSPFDIPEAESELVAGFHTEYSGIRFALFFLAEYLHAFAVAAIAATVFLAGWQWPLLPPYLWFMVKTGLLFLVMVWVRATLPRLRLDQLMGLCWKVLVPLALANLLATGLGVALYQQFLE